MPAMKGRREGEKLGACQPMYQWCLCLPIHQSPKVGHLERGRRGGRRGGERGGESGGERGEERGGRRGGERRGERGGKRGGGRGGELV